MFQQSDYIVITKGHQVVCEHPLDHEGIIIGRAAHCDVVLSDPALAARSHLVRKAHGSVFARRLDRLDLSNWFVLAEGVPIRLGEAHAMRRERRAGYPSRDGSCAETVSEEIFGHSAQICRWRVFVGLTSSSRSSTVEDTVLVGSHPGSDIVLHDATVSAIHCRLESTPEGLLIQDLASKNGTYVDGVRIRTARLTRSARLVTGKTTLRLVAEERASPHEEFVAHSDVMRSVLEEVDRTAPLPWPVLAVGESGVGKEGIARRLHERSRRVGRFVSINAGSLPRDLIESELFGHVKGAFTGAMNDRKGAFELADGGTLFLDEIGELPLSLQTQLLRVLETWEIRPVGSEESMRVDVRLICATHRDLPGMVRDGTFREDLYYRLNRLAIAVPPLRERIDDIAPLAKHFLRECAKDTGEHEISEAAMQLLMGEHWPGNVRQLRNVVTLAAAMSAHVRVGTEDVRFALQRLGHGEPLQHPNRKPADALRKVIADNGGKIARAARVLGMPRSTLRDRVKKMST